jgi:hypothetical protein
MSQAGQEPSEDVLASGPFQRLQPSHKPDQVLQDESHVGGQLAQGHFQVVTMNNEVRDAVLVQDRRPGTDVMI